uniref:CUB domain-containing protein n=1 Tax=Timema douglasi TaxID=61478 RepID=A0A7R8Z7A1_TIMDO|nr:unnamed protein product [Timema douglasi]
MARDRKYSRHCGQLKAFDVESDRKFFRVTFRSNDRLDGTGFKASYQFLDKVDSYTAKPTNRNAASTAGDLPASVVVCETGIVDDGEIGVLNPIHLSKLLEHIVVVSECSHARITCTVDNFGADDPMTTIDPCHHRRTGKSPSPSLASFHQREESNFSFHFPEGTSYQPLKCLAIRESPLTPIHSHTDDLERDLATLRVKTLHTLPEDHHEEEVCQDYRTRSNSQAERGSILSPLSWGNRHKG